MQRLPSRHYGKCLYKPSTIEELQHQAEAELWTSFMVPLPVEVIQHIYDRTGFEFSKVDVLAGRSGHSKARIDASFYHKGQLVDLQNNHARGEEDTEDV